MTANVPFCFCFRTQHRAARVYIFSHVAPNAKVINAADGSVVGTIHLGGMPEQAVSDDNGHVYSDIRDRGNVAVIDANMARFPPTTISPVEASSLPAAKPQTIMMPHAGDGKIIDALPIGAGDDAAIFNPKTKDTYSSQVDGTLTIVKEKSPVSFVIEQTVQTKPSAKQMVWDSKQTGYTDCSGLRSASFSATGRSALWFRPDGAGFIFNSGSRQVTSRTSLTAAYWLSTVNRLIDYQAHPRRKRRMESGLRGKVSRIQPAQPRCSAGQRRVLLNAHIRPRCRARTFQHRCGTDPSGRQPIQPRSACTADVAVSSQSPATLRHDGW